MNRLEKTSIHVEEGGPISRIAASTLGRVGGLTNLMLTGNALKDPSRSLFHKYLPDRFEEHKHDAELIANSSDDNREALKDTVLRLGGTNTIDDIVWKKDRGDNLPWYRRLGGRVLHNQKVSLPMRLIGMPQTLVTNAITPLLRASHYNRMSDTIGEYMHEPAVTQHELGHALDFNSLYGIKPGKGNMASKPLKGLAGDLYHASYFMIPGANLVHEARANSLSDDALKKALGANSKEYKQNAIKRTRVLPAGYGSYVGTLAANPIAGMIAGRAYGAVQAAKLQKDFDEEYGNDKDPNVETNNKLKKAAAFGDSRDKLPTLYGSRFIPNNKLQHEMVKERQRLVDEWEKGWDKGDNTDWGAHPDMSGFDPDFENRWSEAFVGPEFDKHFDKNRLQKAAAFGAMMGKRAIALNPMVLSSLAGAAIGGGGTAIYDWLKGTKENKLRRAMIGAGVGGLTGAGLGHFAGKLTPAAKPEVQPTTPKVEKRVSGIGDLKDFGEDSLAASKSKLVDSIGKQDSHHLKIDAIKKRMNEDSHRVTGFREDVGRAQFEESGEYSRWLQRDAKDREALNSVYDREDRDKASLLDDYNQFRSQSTSNALSKDRDRLLYDRDFVRKALASPADEPEGVFKKLFSGGNIRIKEYGVTNDYPDDGPGRLYYDKYPTYYGSSLGFGPKTYTPALNYKLGPWEGSGALTNRFFLPAGREGYSPSGTHEPQEIKTLTSRPGT